VVQTGKESENLGELVVSLDGSKLTFESFRLHPIDESISGDRTIAEEIDKLKKAVSEVLGLRGYSIDQPLAIVPEDISNSFTDIAASTPLANLITDAFRIATKADIGFTANGMMRAPLLRGKSGVQTVCDVFSVSPLGAGVVDMTAGSALVTAYVFGQELKHLLEFLLVENPTHPGESFPRCSGMRFHYDPSRPKFDVVTSIEIGDLDRGYSAIDITGTAERLYSLTCPSYFALIAVAIPRFTMGKLTLAPKNRDGQPFKSRAEALEEPRDNTPYLLPPHGTLDRASLATTVGEGTIREIKEWQAIMDYLRALPVSGQNKLPRILVDERAKEVRAIRAR
jgi:5'-nucleotidase/UDP-sugar diphosphatase